jgi:hypothetical protein
MPVAGAARIASGDAGFCNRLNIVVFLTGALPHYNPDTVIVRSRKEANGDRQRRRGRAVVVGRDEAHCRGVSNQGVSW